MAIALGGFSDGAARRRPAGQGVSPGRGHLRAACGPGARTPNCGAVSTHVTDDPAASRQAALAEARDPAGGSQAGHGRAEPAASGKPIDSRLLKKSFAQLEPQSDKATAYFYGNLFVRNPDIRALFPLAMNGQRRRLFDGLARCVWGADQPEALTEYLCQLARDHRKFGVQDEHYRSFCDTLLASLRTFAGDAWSGQTAAAWQALLDHVARVMTGAARAAAAEPAWWLGEVVRHDRRTPDLAVLTVRPEAHQPLRYQAGQYISVQVPRWPRVWRCYSAANAPRPDGTLDLHVRAVPGGRISAELVEHTGPGDTLLLGPARGTMTAAAAARTGGILCVAGGTGLAPLKALAEEFAAAGEGADVPAIRLLTGARHLDDLYDLADLRRLEAACPSLTVIPVIAPPGSAVAREALPAAAARELTAETSDIYLCGPDGMVRTLRRRLAALAPAARIHADEPRAWRPDRRQCQHAGDGDEAAGRGGPTPVPGPADNSGPTPVPGPADSSGLPPTGCPAQGRHPRQPAAPSPPPGCPPIGRVG